MSASSSTSDAHNAQNPFDYQAYLVTAWTLAGVGIVLSVGRFVIRIRKASRFAPDDIAHAFAMVMQIIYTILYSLLFPYANQVELASLGRAPLPSESDLKKFLHLLIPTEMIFWIVIFSVKLTFLLLYRQIFSVSKRFMRAWWAIASYILVSFLACFLTPLWSCGTPAQLYDTSACLSNNAANVVDNFAETAVGLNIAGDLAIMALPLWMLRQLQMGPRHKMGLAVMFLLGLIIICFDIIRIATGDGGGDKSLASLWETLEPSVAVIVATLPTYRLLLPKSAAKKSSSYRNIRTTENTLGSRRPINRSYELGEQTQMSKGSKTGSTTSILGEEQEPSHAASAV